MPLVRRREGEATRLVVELYLKRLAAICLLCAIVMGGCKRSDPAQTEIGGGSLIFDNASPEEREALATPVNFQLTDANFSRWEQAQSNLDNLPRSAFNSSSPAPTGGNAIDRAVARLQGSPRTRRAIESAGLSVRDFVLETIALAQATEAAQTGKSTSSAPVPPGNFQFVERYRSRILRAQTAMRAAQRQMEAEVRSDTATTFETEPAAEQGGNAESTPPREPLPDSSPRGHRDTVPTTDSLASLR